MTLRTPLCDLLGIEHPIIQSGMGTVAGPDLVAEVSRAGGLGVLAGLHLPADELRKRIHQVRALTDRPFGVNLWLHSELRPPVDPATVPPERLDAVQSVLNRFRERLELPASHARPPQMPDLVDQALAVILEERVPVWSIGLGLATPDMVARCRKRGVKIMAMVATVEDARAADAVGTDVIVAQGSEAGGHRSTGVKRPREDASVGTMALVPQVVDAVRSPVVAAGGIADGRGLVAALALGAQGVLMGTRFVATRESKATEFWKKRLLESDGGDTTLTQALTGLWARAARNTFTKEYEASAAPVLPALLQAAAAHDVYSASAQRDSGEYFPMWSGQSSGLVHDLPGAGEVVERIVREAGGVLVSLSHQ